MRDEQAGLSSFDLLLGVERNLGLVPHTPVVHPLESEAGGAHSGSSLAS